MKRHIWQSGKDTARNIRSAGEAQDFSAQAISADKHGKKEFPASGRELCETAPSVEEETDGCIVVSHVSKSFGEDQVLRDVSRSFARGKIHGIVGNNGSGKTVLMKCIVGFLRPDSGRILVEGRQVGKDMDFPEDLGIIIETPGFLPNCTGVKNLQLLADMRKKITIQEIRDSIRRVGLNPDMKKPVSKYSLGMRQRLGIAQAIMEDPQLLILDEPFNGLDKSAAEKMRCLLRELKAEGKTILLASHNQADIDQLCDTVCEMDAGVMTMIRQKPLEENTKQGLTEPFAEEKTNVTAHSLLPELNLLENAALPLACMGMPKRQREDRAREVLVRLGLKNLLHARPDMVTERQRQLVWEVQRILKAENGKQKKEASPQEDTQSGGCKKAEDTTEKERQDGEI